MTQKWQIKYRTKLVKLNKGCLKWQIPTHVHKYLHIHILFTYTHICINTHIPIHPHTYIYIHRANLWPHAKLYDEALCVASVDGGGGPSGARDLPVGRDGPAYTYTHTVHIHIHNTHTYIYTCIQAVYRSSVISLTFLISCVRQCYNW